MTLFYWLNPDRHSQFELFQLSRRYSQVHHIEPFESSLPPKSHSVDSLDELKTAFEVTERSSPGISELFAKLILNKLQNGGNVEERTRTALERLTRSTD